MSDMVYIREISTSTFLHFSYNNEGYSLRDFSVPGVGPAIVIETQKSGRTASAIRKLANNKKHGNRLIPVNGKGTPISDYAFWHSTTLQVNHQIPPSPSPRENWLRNWMMEHLGKIIVAVVPIILVALILAWLGLKQ